MTEYAFNMRNSNYVIVLMNLYHLLSLVYIRSVIDTTINTGTLVNYFHYFLEINVSSYILCTF